MLDEHGKWLAEAEGYLETSLARLREAARLHGTGLAIDEAPSNEMVRKSLVTMRVAMQILDDLRRAKAA